MNKSCTADFGMGVLLIVLAGWISNVALADTLLIDEVRARQAMQLPNNGLTMQAVEDRWGAPQQRYGAVGEPPITRWQYTDYSVYFERDRVITSVLNYETISQ